MSTINTVKYPETEEAVTFPMPIRFGETPTTEFFSSRDTIKVTLTDWPRPGYKERCAEMIMSTWADEPAIPLHKISAEDVEKIFMQLLQGKVLPNSMESLTFSFKIEGITLVEITHILRHRMFASIHAQCTADRFLTHDSAMIPTSIENSQFADEYRALTIQAKELYQKMCDSTEISIMDARYILPRNNRYFYYVTMNLKDAMAFIKQRRCTAIQPELDNEIARQIYNHITALIPEVRHVLSMACDGSCHTTFGNDAHTTRLYQPDINHAQIISEKKKKNINPLNYLYEKTREQMGSFYQRVVNKNIGK